MKEKWFSGSGAAFRIAPLRGRGPQPLELYAAHALNVTRNSLYCVPGHYLANIKSAAAIIVCRAMFSVVLFITKMNKKHTYWHIYERGSAAVNARI